MRVTATPHTMLIDMNRCEEELAMAFPQVAWLFLNLSRKTISHRSLLRSPQPEGDSGNIPKIYQQVEAPRCTWDAAQELYEQLPVIGGGSAGCDAGWGISQY